MKVLAVGDIHTKTWIFDLVESVINSYDAVVFCGDYADDFGARAMQSILTWEYLRELFTKYPGKIYAVQGNHDYVYATHIHPTQSGYNHTTQILINLPDHRHLKEFIKSLPFVLEVDGVTYSHAGIDETWNGITNDLSMWNDNSPIWVRPDWAQYKKIKQVFGHTPQKTVTEIEPGCWAIDTFSTYPNGTPFGDGTMLEVIDGQLFRKTKIHATNNNTTRFEGRVS